MTLSTKKTPSNSKESDQGNQTLISALTALFAELINVISFFEDRAVAITEDVAKEIQDFLKDHD